MQKFQVSFIGLSTLFGKTSSLLLKQSPFIKCIKLYDETNIDPALDIAGLNTQCKVKAFLGKSQLHSALQDADIIVIGDDCGNAGSPSTDLFIETAPKVLDYAKAIAAAAPEAIVVVAASPLNSLVPLVNQTLVCHGCDNPNKVVGATSVDNIRANALLASHLNMDPLKVVLPVIGGSSEHTRVPIFSQAKPNTPLSKEIQIELRRNIQLGDYEIKKWKNQSESLNKAYATMRLLNSIMAGLRGESHVIDIALTNTDIIKGITYFSLPVLFGREGVKPKIGLPKLTEAEENMVEISLNHMTLDAEKANKFFKKMFPTASSPNIGENNKTATDNLEEKTKFTQGHTLINPTVPKVAEKLLPTNSLSKETTANNRKSDYPSVVNPSLKKSEPPLPLLDPIIPEGAEPHATLSHHQDHPNNINSEENSTIIAINKEAKTKYNIKSREELTYNSVMTFKEKEARTLRALGRTEDIIETLSEQPDKKAENKPFNDKTIESQTAVDHSRKIRKSIGSREMHTNVPQNYHHTERNESNLIDTKAKNTKSVDFPKEPKVKEDKRVSHVSKWVKMKNNYRKDSNFSNRSDNKILMEFNKRMKKQYANHYPAGTTSCLRDQFFWKYDNAFSKNGQVNSSTLKREKLLGNRKINEQRLVEPKSRPIPNNYITLIDADTKKVIPFSEQKDKSIQLVYKNELEAIEATDKNKEQITKTKFISKLPPSGTRGESSPPLPVVSSGYQNKWTPLPFHQENKKMAKSTVVRAVINYDKNKKMTAKDIQSYIKSKIKENRMKCNSSIVWVHKKPKSEQMKFKNNKSQAANEITNSVSSKQNNNRNEMLNRNSIALGAGLDNVATLNLDPVGNDSSKTTNNIDNEELRLNIKKAILSSASSSSEIAAQPVNSSLKTKELNNSEISSTERSKNEQLNGQENSKKINAKVLDKMKGINQLQIHEKNNLFVPFPTQPPASSKTKNKKKNFSKHTEQPINLPDKEEGLNKISSSVNSRKSDPPQKMKDEAKNGKRVTNLDQKIKFGKTQLKRVASSLDQVKPKAIICEIDSVNKNIENNLISRKTRTPTVELNKRTSNSKTETSSDKIGKQLISSNSSLPTPINSKLSESEMIKTSCGSRSKTSIDLSSLTMSGSKLNRRENEPDKLKRNKSFSYLDQSELNKEMNKGDKSLLQILQTSQNKKNPQNDCFNAQSSDIKALDNKQVDNEKQNNLSAKHSPSENEKVEVKIVDDKLQENLSQEKLAKDKQKQNLDNETEIHAPLDKESVSSEPSAHEPKRTLLQMLASQTTKSLGKGNISTTSMETFKGPKFVDEMELQKIKTLKYLKFQWKESLHALKTKKVRGSKTVPNKKQRNIHKQYQPPSNSTNFNFSLTESKKIKNPNFTLTPSTQKQTRTLQTKKKSHHTIPTENNFLQRFDKVKPDKSILEKYSKKNNENQGRRLATQKVTSLVVSKAEIKNLRKFKKKKKKKARSLLDALDEQKNLRKTMENNFNSLHHLKMLSSRGNNFRENKPKIVNTKKQNGIMYSNQNFTGSVAECVKSLIKPPPVLKIKNGCGDLFFPTPMNAQTLMLRNVKDLIGSSAIKTNESSYKPLFIPSMKSSKYKQLDNNLR